MSGDVFQVLTPGMGATLQDGGRLGWRRFGVPPGGPMDDHAALWANRLLDNPVTAPVLELLLQGATLVALRDAWIVVTGAAATATVPLWRVVRVAEGEHIEFHRNHSGVWTYVAIAGGFLAPTVLGSVSGYPRAGIGCVLATNHVLRSADAEFELPAGVGGIALSPSERRNYSSPPALHVWPGPQWDLFNALDKEVFFSQTWRVSAQCDRVGYRLEGEPLRSVPGQMISEPVRLGTVQVPGSGRPIVTMRDGPTVGGYPKLGLVDSADLSWLAQCRPGQRVRFELLS
jgi:biotin-dependent carboxylase-like uncharacterized protein